MKKKLSKYNPTPIDQETKAKIIDRWRYSKLNSIETIAAEFNLSTDRIHKVINQYLSSKILPP